MMRTNVQDRSTLTFLLVFANEILIIIFIITTYLLLPSMKMAKNERNIDNEITPC